MPKATYSDSEHPFTHGGYRLSRYEVRLTVDLSFDEGTNQFIARCRETGSVVQADSPREASRLALEAAFDAMER